MENTTIKRNSNFCNTDLPCKIINKFNFNGKDFNYNELVTIIYEDGSREKGNLQWNDGYFGYIYIIPPIIPSHCHCHDIKRKIINIIREDE